MAVEVQEVLDDVEVVNTFEVTAYVPKYTICGDNIYIAGYTTNPPQWLLDTIDNSINNSNLADEVSDLDVRFQNFQNGYTQKIGYLENQDTALAFDISTLKVSSVTNTAGIQRLDSTKITANDAQAISEAVIGAWSNTTGGAWFNSKVSAVSNVAYSAARSASNLTAVMNSQQDQMNALVGDVTILQKQVDGRVETWFSLDKPVLVDGSVDVTKEPYATWLANDELAVHTGDTYIHYELDVYGNKKILGTYKFGAGTTEDTYVWSIFTDDLASTAYAAALQAQTTADGKIVTYYQSDMPVGSYGDLWLDSDDNDKMYRHNGTTWIEVSDKRIQASVTRLDEATVTVDGEARAKSSLKVDANGKIAGYVAESGSTSEFSIYADKFKIARVDNGQEVGAPFSVDTITNQIKFNGVVEFTNVNGTSSLLTAGNAAADINANTTTIDGGKITTNTLTAAHIKTGEITVNYLNFSTPAYRAGFADVIGGVLLEETSFMQDFFAIANNAENVTSKLLSNNVSQLTYFAVWCTWYREDDDIVVWVYPGNLYDANYNSYGGVGGGTKWRMNWTDAQIATSKMIALNCSSDNVTNGLGAVVSTQSYPTFMTVPTDYRTAAVRMGFSLGPSGGGSGIAHVSVNFSLIGLYASGTASIVTYTPETGGMATKIGKMYEYDVAAGGTCYAQLPIGVYSVYGKITYTIPEHTTTVVILGRPTTITQPAATYTEDAYIRIYGRQPEDRGMSVVSTTQTGQTRIVVETWHTPPSVPGQTFPSTYTAIPVNCKIKLMKVG